MKPLGKTWSTQYSSPLSRGAKLSKTLSTPTGKPMTREDEGIIIQKNLKIIKKTILFVEVRISAIVN